MAIHLVHSLPVVAPLLPRPILTGLNLDHPAAVEQARGLLFWWNDPIASMDQVRPAIGRLPWVGSGVGVSGSPFGLGLDCNANGRGARLAAPAHLSGLLPVTLVCHWFQVSTPVASSELFCVTYTDTDTAPFMQYKIGYTATPAYDGGFNDGGALQHCTGSGTPSTGAFHVGVFTIANGAQALYLDGVSAATSSFAASAPIFVTPQLGIGVTSSDVTTRNPGAYILDCRIYNRAFSALEVRQFSDSMLRLALYPQFVEPVMLNIASERRFLLGRH
jgi:hypothetical protein